MKRRYVLGYMLPVLVVITFSMLPVVRSSSSYFAPAFALGFWFMTLPIFFLAPLSWAHRMSSAEYAKLSSRWFARTLPTTLGSIVVGFLPNTIVETALVLVAMAICLSKFPSSLNVVAAGVAIRKRSAFRTVIVALPVCIILAILLSFSPTPIMLVSAVLCGCIAWRLLEAVDRAHPDDRRPTSLL